MRDRDSEASVFDVHPISDGGRILPDSERVDVRK